MLPAQAHPQQCAVAGEAVQLLGAGLDGDASSASEGDALRTLAMRLGEWPLLLNCELVGRTIRLHDMV